MNMDSEKPNTKSASSTKKQGQSQLAQDDGKSSGYSSELSNFMQKPEVIQMHLDILYKSVQFLDK